MKILRLIKYKYIRENNLSFFFFLFFGSSIFFSGLTNLVRHQGLGERWELTPSCNSAG